MGGAPAAAPSGSASARAPRLPSIPGASPRGGGSTARSMGASPRDDPYDDPSGAAADPLLMPRSMARAVRHYQTTAQPSGLYSPRTMFKPHIYTADYAPTERA